MSFPFQFYHFQYLFGINQTASTAACTNFALLCVGSSRKLIFDLLLDSTTSTAACTNFAPFFVGSSLDSTASTGTCTNPAPFFVGSSRKLIVDLLLDPTASTAAYTNLAERSRPFPTNACRFHGSLYQSCGTVKTVPYKCLPLVSKPAGQNKIVIKIMPVFLN